MRKWVLWGHRFSDYQDMFDCSADLESKRILEYACGPTTVNAELTAKGVRISSYDPWFTADLLQTKQHFYAYFEKQMLHMRQHPERFDFEKYGGMETFFQNRRQGFDLFFQDYQQGLDQGRYLIKPDFVTASFDMIFCSSYLFADLEGQDLAFQLQTIKEMLRMAQEVRIYPLTDQLGRPSELLGPVLLALQKDNYKVQIQSVAFRLVPESKAMLRIQAQRCELE